MSNKIAELLNAKPEAVPEVAPEVAPEVVAEDPEVPVEEVEGDDARIKDLSALAEDLGVDADEIYNLKVTMRGNDEEPISIGDLKDEYYKKVDALVDTNQLQNQIAELQGQLNMRQQQPQYAPEMQQINAELESIKQSFNSIDWPAYEQQSPGEAALQRQKFTDAFNQVDARRNQMVQQAEQQQYQQQHQVREYQQQQLRQLIPEWQDDTVAKQGKADVTNFLINNNFSQQEIASIGDSRIIKMVNDYMTLKNSVDAAKPSEKRVLKKGATLKGGSLGIHSDTKAKKAADILARGREAKSRNGKQQAINDLLNADNVL